MMVARVTVFRAGRQERASTFGIVASIPGVSEPGQRRGVSVAAWKRGVLDSGLAGVVKD
jgi:hypothetical protein